MLKNLNKSDFEKLLFGFLLLCVVIVACVKYFQVGDVSSNWVNVITIIAGFFTVRKVVSYFKKTESKEDKSEI